MTTRIANTPLCFYSYAPPVTTRPPCWSVPRRERWRTSRWPKPSNSHPMQYPAICVVFSCCTDSKFPKANWALRCSSVDLCGQPLSETPQLRVGGGVLVAETEKVRLKGGDSRCSRGPPASNKPLSQNRWRRSTHHTASPEQSLLLLPITLLLDSFFLILANVVAAKFA